MRRREGGVLGRMRVAAREEGYPSCDTIDHSSREWNVAAGFAEAREGVAVRGRTRPCSHLEPWVDGLLHQVVYVPERKKETQKIIAYSAWRLLLWPRPLFTGGAPPGGGALYGHTGFYGFSLYTL